MFNNCYRIICAKIGKFILGLIYVSCCIIGQLGLSMIVWADNLLYIQIEDLDEYKLQAWDEYEIDVQAQISASLGDSPRFVVDPTSLSAVQLEQAYKDWIAQDFIQSQWLAELRQLVLHKGYDAVRVLLLGKHVRGADEYSSVAILDFRPHLFGKFEVRNVSFSHVDPLYVVADYFLVSNLPYKHGFEYKLSIGIYDKLGDKLSVQLMPGHSSGELVTDLTAQFASSWLDSDVHTADSLLTDCVLGRLHPDFRTSVLAKQEADRYYQANYTVIVGATETVRSGKFRKLICEGQGLFDVLSDGVEHGIGSLPASRVDDIEHIRLNIVNPLEIRPSAIDPIGDYNSDYYQVKISHPADSNIKVVKRLEKYYCARYELTTAYAINNNQPLTMPDAIAYHLNFESASLTAATAVNERYTYLHTKLAMREEQLILTEDEPRLYTLLQDPLEQINALDRITVTYTVTSSAYPAGQLAGPASYDFSQLSSADNATTMSGSTWHIANNFDIATHTNTPSHSVSGLGQTILFYEGMSLGGYFQEDSTYYNATLMLVHNEVASPHTGWRGVTWCAPPATELTIAQQFDCTLNRSSSTWTTCTEKNNIANTQEYRFLLNRPGQLFVPSSTPSHCTFAQPGFAVSLNISVLTVDVNVDVERANVCSFDQYYTSRRSTGCRRNELRWGSMMTNAVRTSVTATDLSIYCEPNPENIAPIVMRAAASKLTQTLRHQFLHPGRDDAIGYDTPFVHVVEKIPEVHSQQINVDDQLYIHQPRAVKDAYLHWMTEYAKLDTWRWLPGGINVQLQDFPDTVNEAAVLLISDINSASSFTVGQVNDEGHVAEILPPAAFDPTTVNLEVPDIGSSLLGTLEYNYPISVRIEYDRAASERLTISAEHFWPLTDFGSLHISNP